uniref:Uncharacterized protein n=1 Tax=Fagus sylvatica TaxID=28930 RepID=A0A2N9FJC1_FAGSY
MGDSFVRTACITPFCRESQETSPISGVMAGHEGYSCSASDASPPKTSNPFSQPASSEGQLGRTVPDKDWGHVSNKHNCLDGGGGDRDGGGGGEGLSSHNSNDLWLVGSKDRKDPEVPAEDLSWILEPESAPLDTETWNAEFTWPEYSRLQGVADKDFVGEHANQIKTHLKPISYQACLSLETPSNFSLSCRFCFGGPCGGNREAVNLSLSLYGFAMANPVAEIVKPAVVESWQ